jgi:predicted patatin/cPLA2 family phospholipase
MFPAIALGGGGIRGVLLVGALQELAKYQSLEFPKGIWGISIGSILATALAYRIHPNDISSVFYDISMDKVIPPLRLSNLMDAHRLKGLYSTDALEDIVVQSFESKGVNLRGAMIRDTPQPLHIVASNITRCTPTVFEGSVRILDAIKASCAIPGVFHPQVIYDSVYVDGAVYTPSIIEILPEDIRNSALILNLCRPNIGIKPEQLHDMSVMKYVEQLYRTNNHYRMNTSLSRNSLWIQNEKISTLESLTEEQKTGLLRSGGEQLARFLSKYVDQPSV